MPRYIVTEIVKYEVVADSAEDACEIVAGDAERDGYYIEVTDRSAERIADSASNLAPDHPFSVQAAPETGR